MAKKVYVGVADSYSEVEYIQSSGTQYIDTGFKPNQNTRVVMDCDLIAQGTVYTPFGTWNDANVGQYICLSYSDAPSALYHGNAYEVGTTSLIGRHTIDANKGTLYVDGRLEVTCATATYSCLYPLYLFTMNDKGTPRSMNMSHMKLYGCQIYDNSTLICDYVPCVNSSAVGGLYDKVSGQFFANAGTGSFAAGAKNGITYNQSGVAHKAKKMYLGIGNVARKAKKGYIGIGGVARPFWTGGELGYYGAITPLSEIRDMLAATSVGNYALFGGGRTQSMSAYSSKVDAYNRSLVRSSPTALSKARMHAAAGSIGNYALFAGGCTTTTASQTTVEAYNLSLTRTSPTALSVSRHQAMRASTQVHAIFAGGSGGTYDDTEGYSRSAVDAYTASLTRSTTKLGSAGGGIGASVGGKTLFVMQYRIDVFDSALTRTQLSWLSWSPSASANVGDYAILAGGVNGTVYYADAYAYDASLTRTTLTNLSSARATVGASLEGYAIFAGGTCTTSSFEDQSSIVDVYDEKLTRKTQTSLSIGKNNHAAATVGDYALFGGGRGKSNTAYDSVDAYVVG